MNNLSKIVLLVTITTAGFSEVTVCFKKNLQDMTKIEETKLNGGLCKGEKNQKEMINNGWKLDNLKITNNDYLFVFKKDDLLLKENTKSSLKKEIIVELENKKKKEVEITKKEKSVEKYKKGEKIYTNKCSSCHGVKGETKILNTTALNKISLDEFKTAIKAYKIGSYNLGNASEMKPYAIGYTSSDIESIYEYIKRIKE